MLSATEWSILKIFCSDLSRSFTKREISLSLGIPYAQTHRSIGRLIDRKLVTQRRQGNSMIVSLDLTAFKPEYVGAEMERAEETMRKYPVIKLIAQDLERVRSIQYICILFGSHADQTARRDSDIDLLFIIPESYNTNTFEKSVKGAITINRVDISITTEKGVIDMWNTAQRVNVANELLKKHIVLRGAEPFLRLRRRYYVG